MLIPTILNSRDEWLRARGFTIGGSDSAAIVGMNPYCTNVDLWEIKTGRKVQEDISDKPYVKYGTYAEAPLRELFKLDYPQYKVMYEENNIFHNPKYPMCHFSADGWLMDENGRMGILEIKTSNILQSFQKERWNGSVPSNYYCQLLHGMLVTEAQFAILKAQLKSEFNGEMRIQTKHYMIERSEVEEDLKYLEEAENKFVEYLKNDEKPALLLPEL